MDKLEFGRLEFIIHSNNKENIRAEIKYKSLISSKNKAVVDRIIPPHALWSC